MLSYIKQLLSGCKSVRVANELVETLEGREMMSISPAQASALVEGHAPAAIVVEASPRKAAAAAKARLTDRATGLSVMAPGGYRLSSKKGIYTLTDGRVYVRFMLGRSPLNLAKTREHMVKQTKMKQVELSGKGKQLMAKGVVGGKRIIVVFTERGNMIDVATFGRTNAKAAGKAGAKGADPVVTLADVARLQAILNSRRGGIAVPLPITVPMRLFTGNDGTRALVPNLPGWQFNADGGIVNGGAAGQGVFSLGVPVLVGLPGFGAQLENNPVGPDGAIAQIWPKYLAMIAGAQVQVTAIQMVPGTAGWLGPNFSSALFAVRFNMNGQGWSALMSSGVADIGSSIGFMFYYSFIAVADGAPGGLGAALMNTWASWDNSAASQRRLNQALLTILTTRVNGFPIDPQVFEEAAFKWDAYIRGDGE